MNVNTNKFVEMKCSTKTKIQLLYDCVDHTRFYIVEMGCQMVKLLYAYIVGPTMFVNLTQPNLYSVGSGPLSVGSTFY